MPEDFNPKHMPNGGCNESIFETLDLTSSVFQEHVKFQDESIDFAKIKNHPPKC